MFLLKVSSVGGAALLSRGNCKAKFSQVICNYQPGLCCSFWDLFSTLHNSVKISSEMKTLPVCSHAVICFFLLLTLEVIAKVN